MSWTVNILHVSQIDTRSKTTNNPRNSGQKYSRRLVEKIDFFSNGYQILKIKSSEDIFWWVAEAEATRKMYQTRTKSMFQMYKTFGKLAIF